MAISKETKEHLKERAIEEFWRLVFLFVYLALLICGFQTYRHLVLAEYHITYVGVGYGLIEALILAKVIMIGEALHIGNWLRSRPRMYVVLYKTVTFSLLVFAFTILEHLVTGLFEGHNLEEIRRGLFEKGKDEILGQVLVMMVSFIPLFALVEMGDMIGEGNMGRVFFGRRRPKVEMVSGGDVKPA